MDISIIEQSAKKQFREILIPSLMEYIKIPNQSPAFDPLWETNGLLEKACHHISEFIMKLVSNLFRN